jgi:hypothetical protein
MRELLHSYSTRPVQIRRVIDAHKGWIESRLGVSLSEAVILETDVSFYNAALPRLGYRDRHAEVPTAIARLIEQLESVEMPPAHVPHIELTRERASRASLKRLLSDASDSCAYSMELVDCPVLLQLKDLSVPLIALSVKYHAGPDSASENGQDVVVIPRSGMDDFVALLKIITRPDRKARLLVAHEEQVVNRCDWDQLVLDPAIVSKLRDDFESFFSRENWFRKMRLPYRRGYLLHGPPGNGKSTAIRAMLTSRGLSAYSIRFFDDHVNDDDLEGLFAWAAREAPAVVLLEDVDRCFPRSGTSKTKVSLQALLNCLDGVASGEGIITLATANDPTALDPAILRRPGRFDRVICFPNPTADLRYQYFVKMHPSFAHANLSEAVEESDGFSFAQLRESFIMAAQVDFCDAGEIKVSNLMESIRSLRDSSHYSAMKGSTGFVVPSTNGRKA